MHTMPTMHSFGQQRARVALSLAIGYYAPPTLAQELSAFTVPWNDDSPGPTSLAELNQNGPLERIRVGDDAHLHTGSKRVRLWGINCTFDACFPTHAEAELIAGRLRKLGINAVRFHHIDPPWGERGSLLIDYQHPDGTSRHFDDERLDRLDYFIHQLQARGIYADLNLHVSRMFTEADGLPGFVAPGEWFNEEVMQQQKVVALFNPTARALNKEFASTLLLHENPYTGRVYATDPGVAIVEVLNETSLIISANTGRLERLPRVYQDELRLLWNSWLTDQYGSTEALTMAWGMSAQSVELLTDADFAEFDQGQASWVVSIQDEAQATASVEPQADGVRSALRLETTTPAAEAWKVGVFQSAINLVEGETYTLSIRAKGTPGKPFSMVLTETTNFTNVGAFFNGQLSSDWQEYRSVFIATPEAAAGPVRFEITGLADQIGEIWISQPSLMEGADTIPTDETLEDSTIALLLGSGSPSQTARRDWYRFLLETEHDYYTDMREYLANDLGVEALLIGTQMFYSPPSVQAQFDIIDTHSYFNDVMFPSGQPDPIDWIIPPEAQVTSPPGLVGEIAGVAVRGKPLLVTETNDGEPNPFSGDTPLIVGAYGSMHDWDGIFLFDLGRRTGDFVEDHSDVGTNPRRLANLLVGGRIFRGYDVEAANNELLVPYDSDIELGIIETLNPTWDVAQARRAGVPLEVALLSKLRLDTTVGAQASTLPDVSGMSRFESDTGQLVWDVSEADRAVISVNTPRTRALTGFTDGASYTLGDVTIEPAMTRRGRSSIALTLLEGTSFQDDARGFITAAGDQQNTDQQWTDATESSVADEWGHAPTLIETINATITLTRPASEVRVWALGPEGQRAAELVVGGDATSARFMLGSATPTIWYELELGTAPAQSGAAPLTDSCDDFCAASGQSANPCSNDRLDCLARCQQEHAWARSRSCDCRAQWDAAVACATAAGEGACSGEDWLDVTASCGPEVTALDVCYGSEVFCHGWQRVPLDDFEDGDGSFVSPVGLMGDWRWQLSNDSTATPDPPLPSQAGSSGSSQAMHIAGTRGEFAQLEAAFDGGPADLSAFEGVGFHARGPGTLSVDFPSQSLVAAEQWGEIHQVQLKLTDTWAYYEVPFEAAISPSGNASTPLQTSELLSIRFSPAPGSFDLTIDTVALIAAPDAVLDDGASSPPDDAPGNDDRADDGQPPEPDAGSVQPPTTDDESVDESDDSPLDPPGLDDDDSTARADGLTDAGTDPTSPDQAGDNDGGCACKLAANSSHSHEGRPPWLLPWLALVLLMGRRRRTEQPYWHFSYPPITQPCDSHDEAH